MSDFAKKKGWIDQEKTASSGDKAPSDPTNVKSTGPRRKTSKGPGTRSERNERFGEVNPAAK